MKKWSQGELLINIVPQWMMFSTYTVSVTDKAIINMMSKEL